MTDEVAFRAVVTRVQCPNFATFARCLVAFPLLRRQARKIDGFVDATIVARRPRTLVLMSFWESPEAITSFNSLVLGHARFATWTYAKGAKVWSVRLRVDRTAYMSRSSVWGSHGVRQLHTA
jgi:hypothetical protein